MPFCSPRVTFALSCGLAVAAIATAVLGKDPRWSGTCSKCGHEWMQYVEPADPTMQCERITSQGSWCYGNVTWFKDKDGER